MLQYARAFRDIFLYFSNTDTLDPTNPNDMYIMSEAELFTCLQVRADTMVKCTMMDRLCYQCTDLFDKDLGDNAIKEIFMKVNLGMAI